MASKKKPKKKGLIRLPKLLIVCNDCRIRVVVFDPKVWDCQVCGSKNITKSAWE